MIKSDTEGALVEAVQAVLQYTADEGDKPWEYVQALCVAAMAMVKRDEEDPVKDERYRPLTAKARKVLEFLKCAEWTSADDLKRVTHRFADCIYILRLNNYLIIRRKPPRSPYVYKLVRGPGWPGWSDEKPVGNKAAEEEAES